MKPQEAGVPFPMAVERAEAPLSIALIYSRLPLPMRRADQMTVAHLIDYLGARGHQVDLFVLDNGEEITPQQRRWLEWRCSRVVVTPHGLVRRFWGLGVGIVRRWPLQVGWFHNRRQVRAVRQAIATNAYDLVYCYYIRSAETVRALARQSLSNRAADGDGKLPELFLAMQLSQSLNTRRLVENFRNPIDLVVYSLESSIVRGYEAKVWADFSRTLLIGERDVDEIRRACRERGLPEIDNVIYSSHGVDARRFSQRQEAPDKQFSLVFSGYMGTNTNVDAITWFADSVWPLVKARVPDAQLRVVGRKPRRAVKNLARRDGIEVTGEVQDPADYIKRATVCINPMRAGAGMQNKLLEYMAAGKPVVATSIANEGIKATPGKHLLIADTSQAFAEAVLDLFADKARREALGQAGRRFVESDWTWEAHFLKLEDDIRAVLGKDGSEQAATRPVA